MGGGFFCVWLKGLGLLAIKIKSLCDPSVATTKIRKALPGGRQPGSQKLVAPG